MKNNIWKIAIVVLVVVAAGVIVVPRMVGTSSNGGASKASDGSSLSLIEKTVGNGKPTLLLLRTST